MSAVANRKHTALRVPPDELERIDQLARQHKLTRTDYLIRAALNELPLNETAEQRLDKLEQRIEALEHYQHLAA